MAYDLYLEERISRILDEKKIHYTAKKMMGGLCYLVDDKMCVGIVKNQFMVRLGEALYEETKNLVGANPMTFTGKPMKGYTFVEPIGIDTEEQLEFWIDKALNFNPFAKRSKKKS